MIFKRLSAGVAGAFTLAGLLATPVHAQTSLAMTSACSKPARAAALSRNAFAELPTIAQQQNIDGITTLRVDISSAGKLLSENVVSSSGNTYIDSEAMRSARLASFTPEIRACSATSGSYLYRVDFTR